MKLRALTFNILDGGHGRHHLIQQALVDSNADIIFLQELHNQETVLQYSEPLNMHGYLAPGRAKRQSAILSRYPLRNSRAYTEWPMYTGLLETAMNLPNGRELHLFGVHLIPFPPRIMEYWRIWQVRRLIEQLKPYKNKLCLIGGDFNTMVSGDHVAKEKWPPLLKFMTITQGSGVYRRALDRLLDANYIDAYRHLNPNKHGHTMPSWEPNSRIDYMFTSQKLGRYLDRAEVFTHSPVIPKASDHLPVLITFDIPD